MSGRTDPREFLPLQTHVFHILLSVIDGSQHGYGIIKDIARRTHGDLMLGTSTLYAAIKRMVKSGVLEEVHPPADADSDDPRRRYYQATRLGTQVAREEALRIKQLNHIVSRTGLLRKTS